MKYLIKYNTEGKVITPPGVTFFSTQMIFVLKEKSLHKNDYFPSTKIEGRTYRSCIIAQDFHATDQIGYHKKFRLVLGTFSPSFQVNRLGSCTFITSRTRIKSIDVVDRAKDVNAPLLLLRLTAAITIENLDISFTLPLNTFVCLL